jgi:hypothetical protein
VHLRLRAFLVILARMRWVLSQENGLRRRFAEYCSSLKSESDSGQGQTAAKTLA